MQLRRKIQQLVFVVCCAGIMWVTSPREASAVVNCEVCDSMMLDWAWACQNSTPGDPPNCNGQPSGYFESEYCRNQWMEVYRCYDCPWCEIG